VHWVNRILLALLLAGAITLWPERSQLAGAWTEDLERVRAERDTLHEGNAALHEQLRLLQAEIDALKTDPREVARIAREDLNLVRPGEVVFEVERIRPGSP
jgi:cell division protein FtsB